MNYYVNLEDPTSKISFILNNNYSIFCSPGQTRTADLYIISVAL